MSRYWQIAAGSWGRDYANLFLKFGMAFVGGSEPIDTMKKVEQGDIVVLKMGTQKILAAGRVIQRDGKHRGDADKDWLRDFDGWDLQAYCYVDWKKPSKPGAIKGLTRKTIQKLHQQKHKDVADDILKTGSDVTVASEPEETRQIEDMEILKFLVKEGLRPSSADDLTNTVSRIRLLAEYYYRHCNWEDIREHETRTFLVVPLLLALGWAEQQIKIELPCSVGKIDIACFNKSYRHERKNDACVAIIETKGFSSGLDYGQKQAKAYSKDFPNCKVVIVTNGYCYKSYLRDGTGQFQTNPSAYINLLKPKERYPIDPENVGGALDAIKWLLPNNLI
jgi:hypothetical protein